MAKGTKPEGGDGGAPKAPGKAGGDVPPAVAALAAGEEVVISAPVHCVGCARKLRRSLQRLDGVGEVIVDSTTDRVVVRGPKAAENAAGAVRVVERRTGRKAVLLSPAPDKLPPPAPVPVPAKGEKTKKKDGGGNNKDATNDLPEIDTKMVVVLRINLHCDACCEEIKRRVLGIKGVEDAVPHLKSSQMMVKGAVEPAALVGLIHSRTGVKAAIFRAEPLEPPPAPKDAPPVAGEESKKHEPAAKNTGEKKDGEEKGNKEEEKRGGGGAEEEDKNPRAEKPSGGGGGAEEQEGSHGGAAEEDAGGGDGVVLESRKKDDRLFTVPLPAGVVTVAPEVALDNAAPYCYSYSYSYPPCYPYAHPCYSYQYQYHPRPYYPPPPPYAYAGGRDVYGCPRYPAEAFTEENPNTCAIV